MKLKDRARPEDALDPGAYYDQHESSRYHLCQEVIQKQLELTARALQFLCLHATADSAGPPFIVDIGCGSGLSGALLSQLQLPWVGLDISKDMLQIAASQTQHPASYSTASPQQQQQQQQQHWDHNQPCSSSCCGLLASDMGQGLPLRPNSIDAAISISALQWIISPPQPKQQQQCSTGHCDTDLSLGKLDARCSGHPSKLLAFFRSLAACLKPGGAAVAQFYPRDAAEAQAVLAAAATVGLRPQLLVDFPHRTPARKYFLHLTKPAAAAAVEQQAVGDAAAAVGVPACPLGWHIGGTCSSWMQQQQQQQQQCASGHGSIISHAAAAASPQCMQQEHQQELQQLQDIEDTSQGGCSSSATVVQQQQVLQRVVSGVDSWVEQYHVKHTKKLLRLMWRAAVDGGLVSCPAQQSTVQHTAAASATAAAAAVHCNAAAAAGADTAAQRSDDWLKVLLRVELPRALLNRCCLCCRDRSISPGSSSGSRGHGSCAVLCSNNKLRHQQLNCYGNKLLLSCVGRAQDMLAAAAAAAGAETTTDEAPTDAQVTGQRAASEAAAAAAAHAFAKQVASAVADALQCKYNNVLQEQQQQAPQSLQQQQQQQQQQNLELPVVEVVSAEWLSSSDMHPRTAEHHPHQQSGKPRRARKQFMQAEFVPLTDDDTPQSSLQQQQQCAAHITEMHETAAGVSCKGLQLRQHVRKSGQAPQHGMDDAVQWLLLDAAEGFAPHLVYCRAHSAEQLAQQTCCEGQQVLRQDVTKPAMVDTSDELVRSCYRDLVDGLVSGMKTVASCAVGADAPCLGVYGAIAVLPVACDSWELLLGCYV